VEAPRVPFQKQQLIAQNLQSVVDLTLDWLICKL
jgi:hypothetical protein